MSEWTRYYPSDALIGMFLAVALAVAVISSLAWLVSLRLTSQAALRHLILHSALISCLLSPVIGLLCGWSGLTLVSLPLLHQEPRSTITIEAIATAPLAHTSPSGAVVPRLLVRERPSVHNKRTPVTNAEVISQPNIDPVPAPAESNAAELTHPTWPTMRWLSFREIAAGVIWVWAVGTLLMLVRFGWNCRQVWQLRRSARPLQNQRVQTLFQDVLQQLGVRFAPLLLTSNRNIAPLAVGFGRPAVVLPDSLLGLVSDDELRDILMHEIAHLQRGDQWIVLLQVLAAAIYWPIVSVHGLCRELQRAREELCDNVVLGRRDAISYGETLLHVGELMVRARSISVTVGIAGQRGELERRIIGLIDPRRNKLITTRRPTAWLVMILCCAGMMVLSGTRFAVVASEESPTSAKNTSSESQANPTASDPPQQPSTRNDQPPNKADAGRMVSLHGKVLGPGQRPVAGARLYLSLDEWTDPVEIGASGTDGSYRLQVPEKTLRRVLAPGFANAEHNAALIATAEGFGPEWEELLDVKGHRMSEMKPEYAHDFHLEADFPITGRVVDAAGKPVAGAVVSVDRIYELSDPRWKLMHPAIKANDPNLMTREQTDPNYWFTPLYPTAWRMIPSATTDAEGRLKLPGVGYDRAIGLRVEGPGVRSTHVSVLTRDDVADFTLAIRGKYPRTRSPNGYFYPPRPNAPEGDAGVQLYGPAPTIEVDPARTIAGIVRDAQTGTPLAGIRVKTAGNYGSAETGSDGRYRLLRMEEQSNILLYIDADTTQHLHVTRELTNAQALGEIVADFEIPGGVLINARVVETGTNQPIVSGKRQHCHDTELAPFVAGYAYYYPLSTNIALKDSPTGQYYQGFPKGSTNNYLVSEIDSDGRFRMMVPPGPGVLLIKAQPGMPMFTELGGRWKESDGLHRLLPYTELAARSKDDGAPAGDAHNFPGFNGPIPLKNVDAYRVINPPSDAKTLDVTLSIPRAPSRKLSFVGPDGQALKGLVVQGLTAPPYHFSVEIAGSEAEVLALEPGQPRQIVVTSTDGQYALATSVTTDDPPIRTLRLEPTASVTGRLLDSSTAKPLVNFQALVGYVDAPAEWGGHGMQPVKTDTTGQFQLSGLVPGLKVSISFQEPDYAGRDFLTNLKSYQADPLSNVVLDSGKLKTVGDIRIKAVPRVPAETKQGR